MKKLLYFTLLYCAYAQAQDLTFTTDFQWLSHPQENDLYSPLEFEEYQSPHYNNEIYSEDTATAGNSAEVYDLALSNNSSSPAYESTEVTPYQYSEIATYETIEIADESSEVTNKKKGSRSFYCDICKLTCPGRDSFLRHNKIHAPAFDRPYKCSEKECPTYFKYMHHLQRHKDTLHPNIKTVEETSQSSSQIISFECLHCPKSFSSRDTLQKHIREKHSSNMEKEKKIYKCGDCSFTTKREPLYQMHLTTCIGIFNNTNLGLLQK